MSSMSEIEDEGRAQYEAWMDERDDARYDHVATDAEAHLEWHANSGVPVGQPCPWDACDPPEHDDEPYDEHAAPVYVPTVPTPPADPDDLPF